MRVRRLKDFLMAATLLLGVAFLAAWLSKGAEVSLHGDARVIDGDSIIVDGTEIRLRGIDAPEMNQICRQGSTHIRCGLLARNTLRGLLAGRPVSCVGWEEDRYGRLLAICNSGEIELNAQMVSRGWAVSYGAYEGLELEARQARSGLWAGDFEIPADWRKDQAMEHGFAHWVASKLGF